MEMSWEGLEVLTTAYRRKWAETMLMLMVGCQGNEESWKGQVASLKKLL